MISSTTFEPGAMYLGKWGQLREIVSIDGPTLVYRMRSRGAKDLGPVLPRVGELREVTTKRFAQWAEREVA